MQNDDGDDDDEADDDDDDNNNNNNVGKTAPTFNSRCKCSVIQSINIFTQFSISYGKPNFPKS
jgi:hypothetical protein